jgi:glycosyltransferase involved in cell wall biosynthesis
MTHVRFVLGRLLRDGGMTLAAFRLAQVLIEAGYRCDVAYADGDPPSGFDLATRVVSGLPNGSVERVEDPGRTAKAVLDGSPDLVVMSIPDSGLLEAVSRDARTVLHAHLNWLACPDATRYWHNVSRPCGVSPGWRCGALRPFLGCTSRARSLSVTPILERRRLERLATEERIGIAAISADQAQLFMNLGLPEQCVTVIPNLGARLTSDELHDAAVRVPEDWRSAVLFVGRLSKEKGAALLPRLRSTLGEDVPLRVFGDGYLRAHLDRQLSRSMCGQVPPRVIAGILLWARGVAFPSLWPEPGGIVGIDAQLAGVPLGAFDVGAPRDWVAAAHFEHGDVEAMGRWLANAAPMSRPRDCDEVAWRQDAYWGAVRDRAAIRFREYHEGGTFLDAGFTAVSSDLRAGLGLDTAAVPREWETP